MMIIKFNEIATKAFIINELDLQLISYLKKVDFKILFHNIT